MLFFFTAFVKMLHAKNEGADIVKQLKPMLFTSLKHYTKEQCLRDVISGVLVAIIALPLSIALALTSGVGPENGLYTAIVAGFIISFFGGSSVQISGPTAAFATIVAGVVIRHGMGGLAIATIMAGILLILMGLFRFGSLLKFIPYTITTGFTAGIALTIFIGQLKDFFGVTYVNGGKAVESLEKLAAFGSSIETLNWQAVLVGVVCLLVMVAWPKVNAKIPASLIAVFIGGAMVQFFQMEVDSIGDLYAISSHLPAPQIPELRWETCVNLLPDAFTIAVLAAVESLLSCVVADGMTNTRHRSDMELIAQGTGNIGSALFGGIPATGAIARTAANIKNGGRTPVAGLVHSVVLVLILVLLMPYTALIPMPVIATILFMVAYNMCQWRTFARLLKTAPKSDIIVLVVTFILTVVFDLVVAIKIGMTLACLLFMKRMSDETDVQGWKYIEAQDDPDSITLRQVPRSTRVYEINGPLFFGASERIADIHVKDFTKCLILRMRSVPAIDTTALNALEHLWEACEKNGVTVLFSHVNEQPMNAMKKAGFFEKVGAENFLAHIDDAIHRAREIAGEHPVE